MTTLTEHFTLDQTIVPETKRAPRPKAKPQAVMFESWEMQGVAGLFDARPLMSKEVSLQSDAGRALLAGVKTYTDDFNTWILSPEGKAALAAKLAERK